MDSSELGVVLLVIGVCSTHAVASLGLLWGKGGQLMVVATQ
jgi:hypothetical protein